MKLSIIIPVYNEARFIKRCIESLYADSDVEIIFIDDGSTDGSVDIIESYRDKLKFTLLKAQHGGVSAVRNLGIKNATGEYITFLDSDDCYMPNAINIMLQAIDKFNYPIIQFNHSRERYNNKECMCSINKLPRKWVLVWNKIYRRDFLLDNDIQFPTDVIFEEDRIFNLRCFHYCDHIYNSSEKTVYKCFDNKSSICHTITKEKVLSSSNALTGMLSTESNPILQGIICRCLGNLWNADDTKRAFKIK